MTRCAYVESRLRALVDGELEPGVSRKVLDHLAHCASCRQAHARLQSLTAMLQDQELEDVPAHFSASLQVRLARHRREREEKAARPGWRRLLDRVVPPAPARGLRWAGAASVLAAALVCTFTFTRGIQAEEVARRAGERWSQIRNYGCEFVSTGIYQGQPRVFKQRQFFRKPGEYRLDTSQDYPLTTFVRPDSIVHYLPGGDWKGHGPLVIIRPRKEGQDALPFPFGVTWQNGGNISLDQLIRQLAQNDKGARVIGREQVGGRECYRLAFSAIPPGGSIRDQYELWIDRESFLPRRVSWYRDAQNHIVTEAEQLQVNYDVVPAGTFDFSVPDGAAVVHGDVDPHVLALPIQRLRGVSYERDPVGAGQEENWSRVQSVPFPVQAPEWLPEGFELVRVRRRVGRWLDMHWIRRDPQGSYSTIKLVQQDGEVEAARAPADAREVKVGTASGELSERKEPFRHLYLSWVSGGTRFAMTASNLNAEEALRMARSMQPVRAPARRVITAGNGGTRAVPAGEPSVLPTEPAAEAAEELRPIVPASENPAPEVVSQEQQQPAMMPEMSDEDLTARETVGPMR